MNGIEFNFVEHDTKPEKNQYAIKAIVDGDSEFTLWSHLGDDFSNFCMSNPYIADINKLIIDIQKLQYELEFEVLDDIKPITVEKIVEQKSDEMLENRGKVKVFYDIFQSHNKITLEK